MNGLIVFETVKKKHAEELNISSKYSTVVNTVQMTVQIYSDRQAPGCGFYKIYKICDFSLTSGFFVKSLGNLRFFTHLCNANHTAAGLRILQNLRFFAINITRKDRQR